VIVKKENRISDLSSILAAEQSEFHAGQASIPVISLSQRLAERDHSS
jgi:hypothetical protein